MVRRPVVVALLLVVLAACGSEAGKVAAKRTTKATKETTTTTTEPETTAPTLPDGGPGYYVWENGDGGTVTYRVPAPATDPAVAPIDAYREATGATDTPTYVVANVDNMAGNSELDVPLLDLVTKAGATVSLSSAGVGAIDAWRDSVGTDNVGLYNQGVDLENGEPSRLVHPGARAMIVLVTLEPVADIARVFTSNGTSSQTGKLFRTR